MSCARGASIVMGRDKHHPGPPSCQADGYVVRGPWRVVTSSSVSTPLPRSPFPGLWTDKRIRAAYSEGAGAHRLFPPAPASPPGVEGPRCVRCGSVRQWVEALEAVGDDGAIRRVSRGGGPGRWRLDPASSDLVRARFPRTRKNSGGYALDRFAESGDELDLLIGSERTLGFIPAAHSRLPPDPSPPARARSRVSTPSPR